MLRLSKTLAVAAALSLGALATGASAATLSIAGGASVAVPGHFDPRPAVDLPSDRLTRFQATRNFGAIGGGLMVDGPARVTYTLLGREASAVNMLKSDGQVLLSLASPGASIHTRQEGGFLDFVFRTSLLGPNLFPGIANGGASDNKDLALVFSSIFNDGRSVIAAFDDGRRDFDHDDLVVRVDVAPVPVPAAGVLLAGALGVMGALRRRRRA